jgi:hypothetical protein
MSTALTSTPKWRIAAEYARRGTNAPITACVALLEARPADVSDDLITVLGGESARYVLDGGEGGRAGYWPRVWAARGLLHAWAPAATAAIIRATEDEAWRVREMAANVIARHQVGDALDAVAALRAAARAVTLLTAAGA